jgi:transcriptional regulator with XRE-family HTH domain
MNKEPPRLRLVTVDEAEETLERQRRGYWLRIARETAGYTQAAVAELIGYRGTSKSSVNAWEDGRRPVPLDKLKALARLYNVQVERFIDPPESGHEVVRHWQQLATGAVELALEDLEQEQETDPDAGDQPGGQLRRRSA